MSHSIHHMISTSFSPGHSRMNLIWFTDETQWKRFDVVLWSHLHYQLNISIYFVYIFCLISIWIRFGEQRKTTWLIALIIEFLFSFSNRSFLIFLLSLFVSTEASAQWCVGALKRRLDVNLLLKLLIWVLPVTIYRQSKWWNRHDRK